MEKLIDQIKSGVIESQATNPSECINLIFAGDFCPDRRIEKLSINNNLSTIYNDVLYDLQKKDLSIVNLECPLTYNANPILKNGPNLIADPLSIKSILYGGFDIVALANNHIMDQGESGLLDTISICEKNGIKTVGSGNDLNSASRHLEVNIKGTSIAILNFSETEFSAATDTSAGANPLNPIKNYHQILQAKDQSDIVIVIVHGGVEQTRLPSPIFKETLRFFADLGVTAVIAHHSHFTSCIEFHRDVPIFYSLGNFLFDREYGSPYWFMSFFTRISIKDKKVCKIELIPYYQFKDGIGLKLMSTNEKQSFLNEISELSSILNDSERYNLYWNEIYSKKRLRYLSIACSLNKFEQRLLRKNIGTSIFLKDSKIAKLLNMYRCPSHRELMEKILETELLMF